MTTSESTPVGRFFWNLTTGQWSWDAGMFEIHGYENGAVAVHSDMVLAHKHDHHRDHAASVLDAVAQRDYQFSNYHRIVDVTGRERTVVAVGESLAVPTGHAHSHRFCRGFMIDVTDDERSNARTAVLLAQQNSAVIQQSMGLLMGSLGLTEDAAFAFLSRASQDHNVRVRELAPRFIAAAAATAHDASRDLPRLLVREAANLAVERAQPRA